MEIQRKSVKIDAARKRTRSNGNGNLGILEESLRLAQDKLNLM